MYLYLCIRVYVSVFVSAECTMHASMGEWPCVSSPHQMWAGTHPPVANAHLKMQRSDICRLGCIAVGVVTNGAMIRAEGWTETETGEGREGGH